MRRSTRLALLTAIAGLVVPVAISQTPVSAVDQDLVVSTTSGAPGTAIVASSASCQMDEDTVGFQYLWVRLVSGTAPDQVLAGTATGFDEDGAATMIVPDWVDPDAPATIEASCVSVDFSFDEDDPEAEPAITQTPYDPVAFDILPSVDAPVQQRTYSRTSMLAGQAFSVQGSGCFLEDASYSYVDVVPGSDLTFANVAEYGISGDGELDGDAFEAFAALVNGGVSISASSDGQVTIDEIGTDLPAGTYSSVAYCATEEGTTLVYEPQLLEITGNAPFDAVDLTVPADSRVATFAGQSCTAGDVSGYLFGEDVTDDFAPDTLARAGSEAPVSPAGLAIERGAADPTFLPATATGAGAGRDRLIDEGGIDLAVTPDADGSWSLTDEVDFDHGFVYGFSVCGDPLADGFIYDSQAAAVDAATVEPTTPTVPPTTPAPAPANAVTGSPTYAG